jgi:hypothetical protein
VDVYGGERAGVHHNFASICYFIGVDVIRVEMHLPHHICSTYLTQ